MLSVILGFTELMMEDGAPADGRMRADLAEIKKAAESGQRLTRQLLAFSHQQPIQPRRLNLNDVIGHHQEILQRVVGRSITLQADLTPTVGDVWADAGHIEQILVNLAVNAKDAMTAQTHDVNAGRYVVLTVADTGIGMSPDTKARIFEPFFTTKPVGKGTGLGLSTVYGIVRQSGGFIDVTSAAGQGTTFLIYFPRSEQAAHAQGEPF